MKKLLPLLLLAGCATSTTVAPYGKDTYILSVADTWGTNQRAELRVKAAREATEHCTKLGKSMKVEGASDSGIAWLSSTSSQLIFSCVQS